ncbi:MAG: 5'/3'-nucleotidase SurE [bacterium]|nr:5'/3'-nucleotidase SurE [bacterium]
MTDTRHVLISNDDGIDAPGLLALEELVRSMPGFRVTVVAPSDQQSASSNSLTLTAPLRIIERGPDRFAVTGTPTDTVLVAMEKILKEDQPDLVLSGINHGPNMGEDVLYSGTVAAAMEGTMCGIPSYALSTSGWHPTDFSGITEFLSHTLENILAFPLRKGSLLNINLPDGPPDAIKGIRVTKLGNRVYQDVITDKVDPHGRPYLWIGGRGPTWDEADGTDNGATEAGYVSITPLLVDLTHYGLHQQMQHLNQDGLAPGPEAAAGHE